MVNLGKLQTCFQGYLVTPESVADIKENVVSNVQASAEFRLSIYADAYRMRLAEALANDFEILHSLLGDEQFHMLCLKYIDAHPSQHFSLRYFGQHMSNFLRCNLPYAATPVLSELAEFEWALIDAFDAENGTVVSLEDMARLAPDAWATMHFKMHDSVRRLEQAWNIQAIWAALKEETTPEAPQKTESPQAILVWRQELKTYFRSLALQEAYAFDAAREGHNFAALCEGVCEWVPEEQAAATTAGFLHRWVSDGIIKEVIVAECDT